MWSSVTSTFSEAGDFQAAMRAEGVSSFAVTGPGRFYARLTQVTLDRLRLLSVEESLPRIAFINAPADRILIAISLGGRCPQVWGETLPQAGDLLTLAVNSSVHTTTQGPSRWAAIWFPLNDLGRYSRALIGRSVSVPAFVGLWRPLGAAIRQLRRLHADAVRAAHTQSETLTMAGATHGLEQQLVHVVIECLSNGPPFQDAVGRHRCYEQMARFEDYLANVPVGDWSVAAISKALAIPERLLRRCCSRQLGTSPSSYLRIRRLNSVHRALHEAGPDTLTVAMAARNFGFRNLGRFSVAYRDLFGVRPSLTLRQRSHSSMSRLRSHRQSKQAPRQKTIELDQCCR